MSQEAEFRLEESFTRRQAFEEFLGGPEIRGIVELMIASFSYSGRLHANAGGHSDWSDAEWARDHGCYRAAAFGVFEALMSAQPDADWAGVPIVVESLKGRILSNLINSGRGPKSKGA